MVGERAHFHRDQINNIDGVTAPPEKGRPGPQSEAQVEYAKDHRGDVPITLYIHCVNAYEKMLSHASRVALVNEATNDWEDRQYMIVYEGALTRLITQELNLSVPYYTSVTRALKNMGCIRQLRRGGSSSKSQWELIKAPTEEAFNNQTKPKQPKQDKYEMCLQQIRDLNKRVLKLEDLIQQLTGVSL